ncbi:hypothetical protein ACIGXM_14195 [Kitasatospora sp. NPDC052896]|uniref:hypothetical protein n=1 Tax=Kitasatospora sp. NPDC052896 TaxID=3364061 RepID=UPI0037C56AB4
MPERITVQLHPSTVDHQALIEYAGENQALPIIGWAVVLTIGETPFPQLTIEPVVEDDCHGPIALGDLLAEGEALSLLEVL